jgi:D-alanyl-D-alanine carboxypeptidase/D-alanyl-D-alanine-endopeptidase (penicillin-binding protein 4)
MKVRLFALLTAILVSHCGNSQQRFENALQTLLEQPEYQHASAGIHIIDLESGEELYSFNSEKLLIPASAMKLVTSAAALKILGPDYRFETKIGYTGKIVDGTLKGDLVIVGGGDPALGSEYFMDHYFHPHFLHTWSQKIKAAGIQNVEGNLILDMSVYETEKIPSTWIWEDLGNYYGAGTSALSVYDNLFRITFRSPQEAGQPAEIIAIYPKVSGLDFQNEVLSSNINRDRAYVFGSPIDGKRIIRGTIPKSRSAFTIKASNPSPEFLLAEDFLAHLNKNGIFTSGNVITRSVNPKQLATIFIQESPELAEIIRILNVESVNLFAEHLVKQVAAEMNGKGSRENGLKIINDFYHHAGLDTMQLIMEDGSGLSHFNLVTPQFFTGLLSFTNSSEEFKNSLPTAGEGTLYSFSSSDFPERTLMAKSGSMTRVRCYSGYLITNKGKQLAFSIMFNHFEGEHAKLINEIEKLLIAIKTFY